MSLPHYRQKLRSKLIACGRNRFMVPVVLEAVNNWWLAYKDWEAEESFKRAFKERRMTARTMVFHVEHQPLNMIRLSEPEKGKQNTGGKSSTGITGMMKRVDPDNFLGKSKKYEFGLHDMSASLLTPDRPIDLQLYGHSFRSQSHPVTKTGTGVSKVEESKYVTFMPVGQAEDMALFLALVEIAKGMRGVSDELYNKVRQIRGEFTRIKLADKDDSHIGFVDISAQDSPIRKYRYGLINEKDVVADDWRKTEERKASAANYTSILETEISRLLRGKDYGVGKFYNEIIIAYRKHASPYFPVFTRWISEGGMKGFFQVTKFGENGMTDECGKTVSVDGISTGW